MSKWPICRQRSSINRLSFFQPPPMSLSYSKAGEFIPFLKSLSELCRWYTYAMHVYVYTHKHRMTAAVTSECSGWKRSGSNLPQWPPACLSTRHIHTGEKQREDREKTPRQTKGGREGTPPPPAWHGRAQLAPRPPSPTHKTPSLPDWVVSLVSWVEFSWMTRCTRNAGEVLACE
jgi:hypothetical protein